MSYLKTLIRARKSPATDFHLCMLQYPSRRNAFYGFFTGQPVSGIWSSILTLENDLYLFERKHTIKSEIIYQLHLRGEQPKDTGLRGDFGEWTSNYEDWLNCQKEYTNEFNKFQRSNIETRKSEDAVEAESSQAILENSIISEDSQQKLPQQSGIDFLMSIAGMFDSTTSNASENVELIVADFILKKHGKTKDASDS